MSNKNKKILIVEDSPAIVRAVSHALTEADYETDSAFNGKEGIEKAKSNKYDLILLDLVMPGLTGFEVLKELRIMGLETPIIVYSNLQSDFTREEAIKMGALAYFEKATTSLSDMVGQINKFLTK